MLRIIINGLSASKLISTIESSTIKDIGDDGNNEIDIVNIESSWCKIVKSKNIIQRKELKTEFLTLGTKLAFFELKQAFIKASILHHFNSEYHIWIETDISGYIIDEVLSQLTLGNSAHYHLVFFFFCKLIPVET